MQSLFSFAVNANCICREIENALQLGYLTTVDIDADLLCKVLDHTERIILFEPEDYDHSEYDDLMDLSKKLHIVNNKGELIKDIYTLKKPKKGDDRNESNVSRGSKEDPGGD